MEARNGVDVVFEADPPSSVGNWEVSFGARVISGGGDDGGPLSCAGACSSTVSVEFSPDGGSYTSFGSVVLTPDDTRYSVSLAPGSSAKGYVRLGFSPVGDALPIIDNVAITAVPEPGMVLMLLAGIAGLSVLPRRA